MNSPCPNGFGSKLSPRVWDVRSYISCKESPAVEHLETLSGDRRHSWTLSHSPQCCQIHCDRGSTVGTTEWWGLSSPDRKRTKLEGETRIVIKINCFVLFLRTCHEESWRIPPFNSISVPSYIDFLKKWGFEFCKTVPNRLWLPTVTAVLFPTVMSWWKVWLRAGCGWWAVSDMEFRRGNYRVKTITHLYSVWSAVSDLLRFEAHTYRNLMRRRQ